MLDEARHELGAVPLRNDGQYSCLQPIFDPTSYSAATQCHPRRSSCPPPTYSPAAVWLRCQRSRPCCTSRRCHSVTSSWAVPCRRLPSQARAPGRKRSGGEREIEEAPAARGSVSSISGTAAMSSSVDAPSSSAGAADGGGGAKAPGTHGTGANVVHLASFGGGMAGMLSLVPQPLRIARSRARKLLTARRLAPSAAPRATVVGMSSAAGVAGMTAMARR